MWRRQEVERVSTHAFLREVGCCRGKAGSEEGALVGSRADVD